MQDKRHVEDDGRKDARFTLIGEAPGYWEALRGRPFCLSVDTRVLMSDLSWKTLGNINVGDLVLTVDEHPPVVEYGITKRTSRRFRKAKVTNKIVRRAEALRIITPRGELIGTPDHRVLTTWRGGRKDPWMRLDKLQRNWVSNGSSIVFVTSPTPQLHSYSAAWLSGFLNGEGHVLGSKSFSGRKNRGYVGFSQNKGPVADEAVAHVKSLGFRLRSKNEQRSYTGKIIERHQIAGGVGESIRFLAATQPTRLINDFLTVIEKNAACLARPEFAKVLARFSVGQQDVVDITTEAGTFIAEGFVVHNCGPSGDTLNRWWRGVGLKRSDFYITNVYPFRPPANKIAAVPKAEIEEWTANLHDRIAALDDPWLIVPTGNTSLKALLGKDSISKHRGSIYEYVDNRGRHIKTIPTLHPAAIFRMTTWEKRCVKDWERIAADGKFRELRLPEREHFIAPTVGEMEWFLEEARAHAEVMAIDIETPGGVVEDVGFSFDPNFSMTIPMESYHWRGDESALASAKAIVKELCGLPCEKVMQNGFFDQYWLASRGIPVVNYAWDTMAMHHCLGSVDEHSLAYMACVPGEVQVLTRLGWERLDRLKEGIQIAQWEKSGMLSWTEPKIHAYDYRGDMISLSSRHLTGKFTPHHRLPILVGRNGHCEVEEVSRMVKRKKLRLPCTGTLTDGRLGYKAIKLCVAVQADGNVVSRRVRFALKKERKIKRLHALCKELNVHIQTGAKNKHNGASTFIVHGPVVEEIINRLGKPKRFGAWLLNIDLQSRQKFIEEIQHWDGCVLSEKAYQYVSIERENVDWVATIAHVTGRRAFLNKDEKRVTVEKRMFIDATETKITFSINKGKVYCLTTQTGLFLARSDGRIFVSGNSIDTREPYWKDDTKDSEKALSGASNLEALWKYNGVDACVTRELFDVYYARLVERDLLEFYHTHYYRMKKPLFAMMQHGILVDTKRRGIRHTRLTAACMGIKRELNEAAGENLYGKTGGLSPKKLARFLYETLRLPKQFNVDKKTREKKITTKETAVRKLMIRFPDKLKTSGQHILDYRRKKKLTEFLNEGRLDGDNRLRSSYKFTTEAGRLNSSKNPMRTGANIQNQDREIRDIFIPDPGCIFLEADLSQVESRIVYCLTKDPYLIELAYRKPWEFDMHKFNASKIFGMAEEKITKEQRYLGKRAVHSAQRGMRGNTLSDKFLEDGYTRTPEECDRMIDTYLREHSGLVTWFRSVRQEILRSRCLVNSWGRRIDFSADRLNDEVFRRGYSFTPQAEAADLLNQWGLIPVYHYLRSLRFRAKLNAQIHDSVLISTPPELAYDIALFLKNSLEREREYEGVPLVIPVEFKLGSTWACEYEFKQLPSHDEFEKAAFDTVQHHETDAR